MAADADKTVWVDLDATLANYTGWKGLHHIGAPIAGARAFMEALRDLGRELGFRVGILTTRTKPDMPDRQGMTTPELRWVVERWLVANQIPFDVIYTGEGKPIGVAYIDDRAVACEPQDRPTAYADALAQTRRLATKH